MTDEQAQRESVREYYDKLGYQYRWFYSDKRSLGIHYGFWNEHTRSSSEALINVYREVRSLLRPKQGEKILDAGCGVGGASLWLAANTSAQYVGITISPIQLEQAKKHAVRRGVADRALFSLQDYHHTSFANGQFDSIFFIESSCYANLDTMAEEMVRILKPGGMLVIADFSHPRTPRNELEARMVRWFCLGFRLPRWQLRTDYERALSAAGFEDIRFHDKTSAIEKSVRRIFVRTIILTPLFGFLRLLHVISRVEFENGFATFAQKKLYERGLFQYGIFTATKPG